MAPQELQAAVQQPPTALPGPAAQAPKAASGGSSPLVPILIAVALLAAASIGYFIDRQRQPARTPVARFLAEGGLTDAG